MLVEIERDVLDESKSVTAALRKCLALGGLAKSAELRDWAVRELRGHPDEAPLPDYRKIRMPLLMEGFAGSGIFRGRQVRVIDLPKEARGVVRDECRWLTLLHTLSNDRAEQRRTSGRRCRASSATAQGYRSHNNVARAMASA